MSTRVVGEEEFGEVGCAVAPVTLPSSGSRGPVKAVALEFAANLFRGNLREKDLEPISLDVIDQAHATRKLFFRGFVVLGVLDCAQALLKSADVGRIVGEGVIGEADSASVILAEESCDRFLRKAKIGEAFAIGLADELVCRFIAPWRCLSLSILSTSFSVASGSSLKMARLDSAAAARRRKYSALS